MGVISLGIRLRHDYFDRWLQTTTSINEVIQDLTQSFFDPEFTPNYMTDILNEWETQLSTLAPNP
jgi:hypothetical protein